MAARRAMAAVALLLAVGLGASCGPSAPASPSGPAAAAAPATAALVSAAGKARLDDLVAQARREGALDGNIRPGLGPVVPELTDAFKRRFGLDFDVQLDTLSTENDLYIKQRAAMQTGAPPTLDGLSGPENRNIEMIEGGFATYVDGWEQLLAEVNPLVASGQVKPEQVSPGPFSGQAFMWATVAKALLYNPNLVAQADLPRTRADLANPKYRGKLATSNFIEAWQIGIRVYPKDEWLNVADQVGQNAAAVLNLPESVNRILLGQLPMADNNEYPYWQAKAKDPQAPIGIHWFADYTQVSSIFSMVPKGARHPAAATLFALWMTTPEAEAIYQRAVPYPNLAYGQSAISQEIRATLKQVGSPALTWYDTPESLETFRWYGTREGQEYAAELTKRLTQRR